MKIPLDRVSAWRFKTDINILFFSALKTLASIIKSSIMHCLGSPIFAPSKPLHVILKGFVQSGALTAQRMGDTTYKKNPHSTANHLRNIRAAEKLSRFIQSRMQPHSREQGEERDTPR